MRIAIIIAHACMYVSTHLMVLLLCGCSCEVGGMDQRKAQAKAEKKAQKKAEAKQEAARQRGEDQVKEEEPVEKEGTKEERQQARVLARRRDRRPRTPLELLLQRLEEKRQSLDAMMKQVGSSVWSGSGLVFSEWAKDVCAKSRTD